MPSLKTNSRIRDAIRLIFSSTIGPDFGPGKVEILVYDLRTYRFLKRNIIKETYFFVFWWMQQITFCDATLSVRNAAELKSLKSLYYYDLQFRPRWFCPCHYDLQTAMLTAVYVNPSSVTIFIVYNSIVIEFCFSIFCWNFTSIVTIDWILV